MHADKQKPTYHHKLPPSTVASEASVHRQKIASLRSSFLAQASDPPKDVPYIGSSASSTANVHSFPSEELPTHSFSPKVPNDVNINGFPTLPYRNSESYIQPGSYSPSLPVLNPPSVPRRIARRSSRLKSNSFNKIPNYKEAIEPKIAPLEPRLADQHTPAWRYISSPYQEQSHPTIIYETLTSVRGQHVDYLEPGVRNSAMFYHRSIVEPPAVITLSPSEPLCLYAARQSELCRSCQKLALSRNSSFHRSSSRHSVSLEN